MLLEAAALAVGTPGVSSVIMSVIGLVGAGGVVKMYKAYLTGRKEKRESEDKVEILFRETLLAQVSGLTSKIEEMYSKQIQMIEDNAGLKAQLKVANDHMRIFKKKAKETRSLQDIAKDIKELDKKLSDMGSKMDEVLKSNRDCIDCHKKK